MVYLAVMPGKRKPKAVAMSALGFYKAEAQAVWFSNGSAEDARRAIKEGRARLVGGADYDAQRAVT